jgi:hypothetical protein
VEQDLRSLPENLSSPRVFDRSLVFCVIYLLATVTSVVARFTTSDYPLGRLTTIANEKISFEVKFVQCMFIVYFYPKKLHIRVQDSEIQMYIVDERKSTKRIIRSRKSSNDRCNSCQKINDTEPMCIQKFWCRMGKSFKAVVLNEVYSN